MTNIPLSAAELGNIWQAYQEKTMLLRVLEHFIEKCEEQEAMTILKSTYSTEEKNVEDIKNIFQSEGSVVPTGFTEQDVNKGVPALFMERFDLMYLRMMSKVLIGLYALHSGMSYREDIRHLYMDFASDIQSTYNQTTDYLLNKGFLPLPPIVSMPKEVEFVETVGYTSGFNLFGKERVLNTVEIGLAYQFLETNITGMHLMSGFAQTAREPEAKKYFLRGIELSKKIISTMSSLMLESNIQPASTWAGIPTDSTVSPFSDKLMMYNTNLLSMFGFGSNVVGAAFSFRNDVLLKMGMIMTNTLDFAKDGGKIMIKHNWMEEPPQAVDRRGLAKV